MKINTTRAETFSDGVMAIVITIMTLKLFPEVNHESTNQDAILVFANLGPNFIAYFISFIMIGILWINHHHMFHMLQKTDESLLLQNLHFLFWMSLIPMATSILGSNPFLSSSAMLYGFIMFMTTLSFTIMRAHTTKKGLVHKAEDKELTKTIHRLALRAKSKSVIGTSAYLISIPLALLNVYISFVCFILPPIIFFMPEGIDDEKLAEKI